MKRILVVSGSRADYGLLEWPVKKLQEEGKVQVITMDDLKEAFSTNESTPNIDWRGGNYL